MLQTLILFILVYFYQNAIKTFLLLFCFFGYEFIAFKGNALHIVLGCSEFFKELRKRNVQCGSNFFYAFNRGIFLAALNLTYISMMTARKLCKLFLT